MRALSAEPSTLASLEHIVGRWLAKDPDGRWQDAHSVKLTLPWIARSRSGTATAIEAVQLHHHIGGPAIRPAAFPPA